VNNKSYKESAQGAVVVVVKRAAPPRSIQIDFSAGHCFSTHNYPRQIVRLLSPCFKTGDSRVFNVNETGRVNDSRRCRISRSPPGRAQCLLPHVNLIRTSPFVGVTANPPLLYRQIFSVYHRAALQRVRMLDCRAAKQRHHLRTTLIPRAKLPLTVATQRANPMRTYNSVRIGDALDSPKAPKSFNPNFCYPLFRTNFQVLFHNPLGLLFNFLSRYLFAIGLREDI